MNEEKNGFNLNVLISLLVGVISLIVVIPSISMIMNKATEVTKPEEYRLVFDKDQDYRLDFNDILLTNTATLTQDFADYDNLISVTLTTDYVLIALDYPNESNLHNLGFLYIADIIYTSENYTFTYLDPVSNDKLYGTYDFTNIEITEEGQVINPIYTPF